jgi:hypothetical protein
MTRKEKIDPIDMHCNSCKASKRVVTHEDAEAFRKEHWEHVGGSISPNTPFNTAIQFGGEQAIIDLIKQQYEAAEESLVEESLVEDVFTGGHNGKAELVKALSGMDKMKFLNQLGVPGADVQALVAETVANQQAKAPLTVQQEREAGMWRGGYSGDNPPLEGWDTHFKSVEYLKKQAQEQLDKAQSHKDHAEALLEAVRILGLED